MEEVMQKIQFWKDVGFLCTGISAAFFMIAAVLFFRWKMWEIWKELTGKSAREGVLQIRRKLEQQ